MKQAANRVIRTLKTTYNGFPAGTIVSCWDKLPHNGMTVYFCYASYNKRRETYIGKVPDFLLV